MQRDCGCGTCLSSGPKEPVGRAMERDGMGECETGVGRVRSD
jgi:hypothetical protein